MLSSISSLNHVLSETLILCKMTKTDCPDCAYDPIRQESTNPYCQTCGGIGVIEQPQLFSIPSSIETYEDVTYSYAEVGRFDKGQINATIDKQEITTTLDTQSQFNMDDQTSIKAFLDQYDYFEWKGTKYVVESFQGNYLEGNFYEIDLTLNQKG